MYMLCEVPLCPLACVRQIKYKLVSLQEFLLHVLRFCVLVTFVEIPVVERPVVELL
jgi:hypothetical protein